MFADDFMVFLCDVLFIFWNQDRILFSFLFIPLSHFRHHALIEILGQDVFNTFIYRTSLKHA